MLGDDGSDDQREDSQETRRPAEIAQGFILNAPPGEFHEVLESVRGILQDDQLIDDQVSKVFPKYIKTQLTPVKIDGTSDYSVILSDFNDIGGRFADPRSKRSFAYDHVTGVVSDILPWTPEIKAEPWRLALDQQWTKYSSDHYHEGSGSVFSSAKEDGLIRLDACLEGHQFQPKKFWNGRWRSVWTISFNPRETKKVILTGLIRLHVHYYEDGNVQLVSTRSCESNINITKPEQVASDIVEAVRKLENDYQRAISENYKTMSDTTFKALRRPLPVIRSKIEWHKLMGYKIGSELKQQ